MSQYFTADEVQRRFKVSRSTLYRWQKDERVGLPAPIKIGHRILWRGSDLDSFDARMVGASTPQPESYA